MPGRNTQTDTRQNRPFGVIGMFDLIKLHRPAAYLQPLCVRRISDLDWRFQQAEQPLDIGQCLTDFTVDKTEKAQGDKQLDHIGVDHDQLTQTHVAAGYLAGGHDHHQGYRTGDDQCLTGVERRQGQAVFHPRCFPALKMGIVFLRLEALITKVLDRLVVQKTVYRAGIGAVVELVALAHKAVAPLGTPDREGAVKHHRAQYRQRIHGAEIGQQNDRNQADFQQRGNDIENHEAQQKADATGAALDIPGQPTRAPRQVKAQIQAVQMLEYPQRDPPHGALGHTGKYRITQFREEYRGETQQTVGRQQSDRH